jgi:glycerophosphoryl diester phosphodiesterase
MAGMSFWRWTLLILSGFGLYTVANYSAEVANVRDRKRVFQDKPFWVIAHRGFSGAYPENTMLSFEKAAELPIDAIELDIHSSRDGKLVVIHDGTLNRTTNMSGRVFDYSWEELKKADAGYRFDPDGNESFPFRGKGVQIPLFEDVLLRFSDKKFIIEIKQTMPAIEDILLRILQKHKMENSVVVASMHHEPLARLRSMNPSIATNLSSAEAREFYRLFRMKVSGFYRASGDALQIPDRYRGDKVVTPAFVEAAHRKGFIMHIWTVNDPDEMRQLIKDGVDGIITDFPDRLVNIVQK